MKYKVDVYRMIKQVLLDIQFERKSVSTLSSTDEVFDDMAINDALLIVIKEINKKIEGSTNGFSAEE